VEPQDGEPIVSHELLLGLMSGALVSFMLGLVGGGGSILAIPLLVHVVGVRSPHVAIGVSAVAVAANALTNLFAHARQQRVKWRCAAVFAASGIAGALAGSTVGKAINGTALLAAFGVLMIGVGVSMFRLRHGSGDPDVLLTRDSAGRLLPRLTGVGIATGAASGFFGIGGGFLITPSLIWATGMPVEVAIGSSLVAVSAFGLTTAANYAFAGLVDWPLAGTFILGGAAGAVLSAPVATTLARRKRVLPVVFATLVIAVGIYVAARGITDLMS
jgi:uncharacterized protein